MFGVSVDLSRANDVLGLQERLALVPETAAVRGVFFNNLEDYLRRALKLNDPTIASVIGDHVRSYSMAPARDFVRACALAGTVINADDPGEGMRQLGRGMVSYVSATWFGRNFCRLLQPNPYTALRWIERTRDFAANYGHYRIEFQREGYFIVHLYDEYAWLDTVQVGGCEGLLDACLVRGTVVVDLDTPFRGRFHVNWTPGPE